MTAPPIVLSSLSAALDGGFTAIADVSAAMSAAGAADDWRCLEIAAADGVTPSAFDGDRPLETVRAALWHELGPKGSALQRLTAGLQDDASARLQTRVRALLAEVVGSQA